jgi:peptidoglycan/xylan/chitin deacetylase (PgdA/CDA1 family)
VALPILHRHGFTATVFVVSRAVGGVNDWDLDGELSGRAMLSAGELRELSRAGLHIGAHSRTHPRLTELPLDRMEDQIAGSRADLEHLIGQPVLTFAYPNGQYSRQTQAVVMHSRYTGACTSEPGSNDPAVPLLELRRIEVLGTDSLMTFALALWAGKSRVWWRLRRAQ